ncbi:hypothetical protein Bcav_0345 [Beutenbergia cavernae DSM 12333]|uniref:Sap, sulfolipid-1-addressing protein n=1 Tax=Beutenbergia cavernae (strain ATCC BAA-8 / DSM 12333 / CCUG 43141 / JCM 11478 / NBRC 16432 / NCIMB 13614 / HKI 0122) TaxID=471853 RepID=C5BWF1_BEUC1|nr:GAP family protein [Beutenbergia cavernae]ACQ78609.1 hypothetical protein Bcav_0345 [Beutenbergia cavernae DSM 12333]
MTPELLGQLAVLALIDSTSFGTLLIPIWLMLAPGRLRAGRVLVFLGTVGTFYFVLGLALLAGATALYGRLGGWLESPTAGYLQLALGVGLFVASFYIGRKKKGDDAADPTAKPGRLSRWRARAMGADAAVVGGAGAVSGSGAAPNATAGSGGAAGSTAGSPGAMSSTTGSGGAAGAYAAPASTVPTGAYAAPAPTGALTTDRRAARSSLLALMGLALGAALIESASMIPYLTAIGLMTGADLQTPTAVGVLALYCAVMLLPALVILGARILAAGLVRRPLEKLEGWMTRSAAETTAWIVGILGFLIARDALMRTGILEQFGVVVS